MEIFKKFFFLSGQDLPPPPSLFMVGLSYPNNFDNPEPQTNMYADLAGSIESEIFLAWYDLDLDERKHLEKNL